MDEKFIKKIAEQLDYNVLYAKFRYDIGMTSDMADEAANFVISKIEEAKNS